MKDSNNCYLILLVVISLSIKWIITLFEFGSNLNILALFNLQDTQYFPIIYSLSEFNISPSYLENITPNKIIGFPIFGMIIHSLLFKLSGIYSFIFLEYLFQIIFIFVVYKLFIKIFNDRKKSFDFVIILFLIYYLLGVLYQFQPNIIFSKLFLLFESNIGTRFPRPLVSGVVIFLSIYYLIDFKEQLKRNFEKNYIIKISILLGLLLNIFFYYFTILSLLIFFIFIKNFKKISDFKVLVNRFILFVFVFTIFSTPFILQQIFLEPDYATRIGLIQIDNTQKIILLKYFLNKFTSISFISIIAILIILFSILNKNEKIKKINFFFFLVVASIISPLIFILFSKSIISIYHYADIMIFNTIFYLFICCFVFLYALIEKTKKLEFIFNRAVSIILILIIITFKGIYERERILKKNNSIHESIKLEKFLQKNKIKNTKFKLFTNDRIASNIWLLNNNKNILLSDGFTNSLPNSKIEYILINSLKHLGFLEKNFKDFLSLGKSEIRNPFFMRLFIYRYQANSVYTYSNLDFYLDDIVDQIQNLSPLRAQNQIIPENEKRRLINLFNNHKIENDLKPDYLIINFSTISENFKISKEDYIEVFSTENYAIYYKS